MVVENVKRLGEHRQVVAVPPIRRHLLDPQKRKLSIDHWSFGVGVSCSDWLNFLGAASRPPWRSTVSPIGIRDGLRKNRRFWRGLFPGLVW